MKQNLATTHVALVAPTYLPVPPKDYGGVENVIYNLAVELAKLGCDVTVFAPDGSSIEGCNIVETGKPTESTIYLHWLKAEQEMFNRIRSQLEGWKGIIHGHTYSGVEYQTHNPNAVICHTHHTGLTANFQRGKPDKLNLIAISQWMQTCHAKQNLTSRIVHNGVDVLSFPLQEAKSDRALWFSRIGFIKSPHVAIEIAKETGLKLDVAGCEKFPEDARYISEIRKSCDGDQIRFIGEVSNAEKTRLMANAKFLLVTSNYGEMFGLHAVEAMSCGTSVLALADGGIRETVWEGGITCKTREELTEIVRYFKHIPAYLCRRNALKFSSKVMAENYSRIYRELQSGNSW